jgi:hypothetical protein
MDTISPAGPAAAGAGAGSSWRDRLRKSRDAAVAGEPPRRFALVCLSFLVIALTLVFLAVARAPEMSITDEPAHAGYLYEVAHGHIPVKGQLIPEEIRYEWYCHNQEQTTGSGVCTGFDASTFQTSAQIYTFGDPPIYYLVTGALVRVISPLVPGAHDFVSVGRAVGALWLFAAMIVLYLAVRKLRVSWPYAFAAAAMLPLCPGILAASSQINSDAPAALCGALALYALARLTVHTRTGYLLPFLITVFTAGTKQLNGLPMLVVAAAALVLAVREHLANRDLRAALRPFLVAVSIGAGYLLVFLGWDVFQNHRGDPNWVNPNAANSVPLTGSKAGDLASNLFGTFQHLTTNYWLGPQVNGESVVIWATLLCVLLGAAPLLVMTLSRSWSWGWLLGLGTFLGISAVALVVEAQVYLENHAYFVIVGGRYAISFLPWTVACLAVVAHRRRLLRSSFLLVSLGLLILFLAETGLLTLGPALSSRNSFLVG